jgi:hypothetical protein
VELDEALKQLENVNNFSFKDLLKICKQFFGEGRIDGSHHIFKTPWIGDPRINIQKVGKDARPYQVRQVKKAILKLRETKK